MVDSCMPTVSAMSRRIIGLRYATPFSKKSRCFSTMHSVTRMIVFRRCSIARMSHCALRSFSPLHAAVVVRHDELVRVLDDVDVGGDGDRLVVHLAEVAGGAALELLDLLDR